MAVMDTLKGIETMAQEGQGSLQEEFDAVRKEGYDKGYADGQASIVLPDPNNPDKKYSQADVDQIVLNTSNDVKAADQAQMDALSAQVADVQKQLLDLQANGAQQVADSIAAFKAQELGKLKALESDFE
jgi:flagellar biosynthesis/type III secretory pathway protein FliH